MIEYRAALESDLKGILQLQKINLPSFLSNEEIQQEGFVTVEHDLELLSKMNKPHPHIVAIDENGVQAYALVMLPEMGEEIEILKPMFAQFEANSDQYELQGKRYFAMGQICIAKAYRGQGVFRGLYLKMRDLMSEHFDCVLTEIDLDNSRSIRAHQKVGFKQWKQYEAADKKWSIVYWDWS
jgi:hypothetical protein